ncbi:MAG: M48 family metalloprotease [Natronomonas sp.]|uniref:M48 family metalloprotease n=1 Tax=Natronomonas sp. TaxID=2184060 RepID=UPI0028700B34|nr:M48 family metalloprotease [Natronomonas sp.]MDR9429871.1 M48 family metalloprotease [Natronomonas sp.]
MVAQAVVILLFALTLTLRAHSRRRECAADDRPVDATADLIALARALVKIQWAATPGRRIRSSLYVHGDEEGMLSRLLATHSPMAERTERLTRANRGRIIRTDDRSDGEGTAGRNGPRSAVSGEEGLDPR